MVSRYFKALILTIVVLFVGLGAISFLDNNRISGISSTIEKNSLDLQESQQLFLYDSLFDDISICNALEKKIDSGKDKASGILAELENAQRNSLFSGDISLLKRKFLLQNIELYLLIQKSVLDCGSENVEPILYFFPDKEYCLDCASQAKVLDSVVAKCDNVRVFAFPHDLDVPVINLLIEKYSVTSYPSIVIKGVKYSGIQKEEAILSKISCAE